MAFTFHPPKTVIEHTMDKLKEYGLVHPDAIFDYAAQDGLRREVTYRDEDFLYQLGRTPSEECVVDAALDFLKSQNIVQPSAGYDKQTFEGFRKEVKNHFEGTWTSISPTMERFMYMLTSVKRPKRLIELGCFWGNTLAWFAGPCIGRNWVYTAEKIYGIDMDTKMIAQAGSNFAKLPNCEALELIGEKAKTALDHLPGPFDFLYIEAKSEDVKGLYLILLKQIYDELPQGAWVMAHDVNDYTERGDLQDYLSWVHDKAHFSNSINFDLDNCGMELSIK